MEFLDCSYIGELLIRKAYHPKIHSFLKLAGMTIFHSTDGYKKLLDNPHKNGGDRAGDNSSTNASINRIGLLLAIYNTFF